MVDFVDLMRELGVTPDVTQNVMRHGGSALDGRTARHEVLHKLVAIFGRVADVMLSTHHHHSTWKADTTGRAWAAGAARAWSVEPPPAPNAC